MNDKINQKPTEITEAEPAVTNPFSLKTGFNFCKPSMVVCGLGCSSTESSVCCFERIGTGTISSLNLCASWAKDSVTWSDYF